MLFTQSKSLCPTRRDEKESGGKNSENVWQKSKHIVREHNQETFNLNFGFQGNIEETRVVMIATDNSYCEFIVNVKVGFCLA